MFIKDLVKTVVSVFLPFRCHVCKNTTQFGVVLCESCLQKLQAIIGPPQITSDTRCDFAVYTLSSYSTFVSDIVKIIKYRPSEKLLRILAGVCKKNSQLESFLKKDAVLIPVPMHSDRLQKRGFNQADLLAEEFSRHCRSHYSPLLQRLRHTRPQADCNEEERLTNLDNAFSLAPGFSPDAFRGKRLVLIDDVATTGTTLQKCADRLLSLRPAEVCAIVVSHSYKKTNKQGC